MSDFLIAVTGVALVLIAASDVFRSLLVPRASTRILRVGPALSMTLFSAWERVAGRITRPRVRQATRASLAPLMMVLMLVAWAALLIVGFGLIFWADRTHFRPTFVSLGDALYAAGSAFSTLGISGTVAGNLTRIAVLTCSIAGLAVVTVVATFLISIQTGFGRRETLVLRLEAHVSVPPAGVAILETYGRERMIEGLDSFFERWEAWAAEMAITHRAFPILLFFRSNDSRCEWLAALGAVLDAAALLDTTVANPPPAARAGAHFLLRTGARVLNDMAGQFGGQSSNAVHEADAARFRRDRHRLAAAGYALVEDEAAARAKFHARRGEYLTALTRLARRLRIDVPDCAAPDRASAPGD